MCATIHLTSFEDEEAFGVQVYGGSYSSDCPQRSKTVCGRLRCIAGSFTALDNIGQDFGKTATLVIKGSQALPTPFLQGAGFLCLYSPPNSGAAALHTVLALRSWKNN